MLWIDWLVLVFAVLLISVIVLQESKDDINDAFSGSKSELFKNQKQRGFEVVLFWATFIIAIAFLLCAIFAGSRLFPRI